MKIKKFRFLFFVLTVVSYCKIRDPFSFKSQNKHNVPILSAIVQLNDKKLALLNFNEDSAVVEQGEVIFEKWKVVKFIDEQSIELNNISKNKHEVLTLSN